MNLLASDKVPKEVSKFIAGSNLVALSNGSLPESRPIVVGETSRHLVSKCLCHIIKVKAPHQHYWVL